MKRVLMFIMVIGITFTIGCTYAIIQGTGPEPIIMNDIKIPYKDVRHFTTEKSVCFNYTGLIDVGDIISKEITNGLGNAAVNVEIRIKGTVGDFFLNLITLGIARCRTYEASGNVVRWVKHSR